MHRKVTLFNFMRTPFALSNFFGLLILVLIVLAGNKYLKQGYSEQVRASALVTTKGVKEIINQKCEQYDLVARAIANHHQERVFELARGAGYPYDLTLIAADIGALFNELRQFVILDEIGQPVVGSEGFKFGDLCREHIARGVLNLRLDMPGELHHCENGAHYDVLINLERGNQQASLYFSFYLLYLQDLLKQFSGSELRLVMVKDEDQSKVMLTSTAIAGKTPVETLSHKQINKVMASVAVSEGGWHVVALPPSGLFEAYNTKIDTASWGVLISILFLYLIFIYYLRAANQARFKAEQKVSYSALFNAGPTVLIEKDIKASAPFEYVSPNVRQVLGFTSEHVVREFCLRDLIHPDDLTLCNQALELAIENRQQTLEMEFRVMRANEQYIWVYGVINIQYDTKGIAKTLQGYLTSIDAQKLAENQATMLINNAPDAILVVDENGKILQTNKRVEALFGYKAPDLIGKSISLILPDFDQELPSIDRLLVCEQEEMEGSCIEGHRIMLGVRINQMVLKSTKVVFAIVLRDITQQKKAQQQMLNAKERAEKLAASRTRFMAMVSHEIRTPMNGVLGMADLLSNTSLNQQQKSYVEVIQQSGDSLVTILNDVLDFSKIDEGGMVLKPVNFELHQVLESCFSLLQPQANLSGVTVRKTYSSECPEVLSGDAMRLRQIVINLLGNAIKFSPNGHVTMQVNAQIQPSQPSPSKQPNHSVLLSIIFTDDGVGISEESQQTLFEPFTQLDSGLSRSFGGTGLGLSISKQLVELMGGNISVRSTLGKGSEFSVALPFGVNQSAQLFQSKPTTEAVDKLVHSDQRKPSILLVEDDAINQKIAESYLADLGVQVSVVQNGVEAIEFWQTHYHTVDLILMDCQMPIMDGYEASRIIRKEEALMEAKHAVVIIAFTADGYEENRKRSKEAGMNDIMVKPIHLEAFNNKVRVWLNRVMADRD
mgnify:CR=1 FL=1